MGDFLGTYTSMLDAGRLDSIMSILGKMKADGIIRTREEFDRELRYLLKGGIDKWARTFVPILPDPDDPVIHSLDMNDNFRGIYSDLSGLFKHVSRLGTSVTSHEKLLSSDLFKARDAVRKLLEDVAIFRYLKEHADLWNEVKYNTFVTERNLSASAWPAKVDSRTRSLVLPQLSSVNATEKRGNVATKIEVTNTSTGQAGGMSRAFRPMNALDSYNDTFWGEVVLTEDPATTLYNGVAYNGVIVEAVITFASNERFNLVEILPFGFFPVQVLDILVSDDGQNFTTWSGFSAQNATLDWLTYRAVPANAKCMKIVFCQENHTPANYLIPKVLVDRAQVWEHILDNELSYLSANVVIAPQDEKARIIDREFNALIDAQQALDAQALKHDYAEGAGGIPEMSYRQRGESMVSAMLEDSADVRRAGLEQLPGRDTEAIEKGGLVEIDKLEYILGAYTIRTSLTEYLPSAEFMSPKYATKGQPVNMAIETTESHQSMALTGGNRQVTSIEYTILIDDNKSRPIVPQGTTRVESEYLGIDCQTLTGKTRLTPATPANEILLMYGEPLTGNDYTIDADGMVALVGFAMALQARESVFTISYDIAAGQDSFDIDDEFNSTALKEPLVASGTDDRGILRLPYHPYVLMEVVNSDDVWYNTGESNAIWYLRRSAGMQNLDGRWFGVAHGTVLWSCDTGDI